MEKIWNSLQDNDVVKGIINSNISCGNLFLMEEALLLVSSFKKEPKNYIVVKKICMRHSNSINEYPH